ncbi:MAG: hypothetical protein A2566_00560 [Candidatus Zambryskibacteria bacterium RIFOXYD1_FULL_40_13]|nr:MAG: hypothetical protein A2123_02375 [Candidatus Zambryskibacteria bacterium GWB1_40_5]OHB16041.1 MAG: hypothetical protein A2566_00560 [Candidatus Zambryskibacteria bacterium RIFOXYD1_FULL_40_13]HBD24976.1 hypothetical protein [Candidatus Zambryskibacteria bacterium]HBO17849.1 hypothetical protein [Candidatus Zambryskibacteria bacterium]HBZ04548.1 hypothetical protein [Candidatus Zambryskibacteria bacterium]
MHKCIPEIGMHVRWNVEDDDKTTRHKRMECFATIYRWEGIRVHSIKERDNKLLVSLTKWGAPIIHGRTLRLRYFSWKNLLPY